MIGRVLASAVAAVMLTVGTAHAATCDRACLKGTMDGYLAALKSHRSGALPLAPGARFTENGQELKLGDGIWRTVSGIRPYRQDILDVKQGVAGAHVVI